MRHLPFLVLLACTSVTEPATPMDERPVDDVVTSRGDWPVGHQQTSLTYAALGTGEDRTLPVEIWYPAVDGGEEAAVYAVAGFVDITHPEVLASAQPEAGPFPVAVYSHGSGGVGALAYPFADLLASHGWVVVAPDHVGNTTLDVFAGVDFVQTAIDRPADITATLDALESGPLADSIEGAGDVSQTLLFGHSLGGYTVFAAPGVPVDVTGLGCPPNSTNPLCAPLNAPDVAAQLRTPPLDSRVKAIVPQAPALVGLFDPEGLDALDAPMLMMSGRRDITTPDVSNARLAWQARTEPDDRWMRLPDGGHYSFITVCDDIPAELLDVVLSGVDNDGCGPSFTPTAEIVPVLASYTLGFGTLHVKGEQRFESLFTGDTLLSEALELQLP